MCAGESYSTRIHTQEISFNADDAKVLQEERAFSSPNLNAPPWTGVFNFSLVLGNCCIVFYDFLSDLGKIQQICSAQ
jgi:hypothetical protein